MAYLTSVRDSISNLRSPRMDSDGNARGCLLLLAALLVGLVFGAVIVWASATDRPLFLAPLLVAVPFAILFVRYPFASILLWLAVYPLLSKNVSAIGSLAHWGLFRLYIPGMLWAVLMMYWARVRPMPRVRFGIPEWAMVLFLTWAACSTLILSQDVREAVLRLYDRTFVPFCMYFLIRLLAPTAQELRRLLPVTVLVVVAQAIVGLMAWFTPQFLPIEWLGTVGDRTVGTLGNPAVYSSTLIFCGLLLFHYAMHTTSRAVRILFFSLFALAIFCVFFSFSRGSWFAGVLVALGLLVLYPRTTLSMTVIAGLVVFLLSTSLLASAFAFAMERLNTDHTAESRIITNVASLRMIEAQPLFGWGYQNYDLFNAQFKEDVGTISAAGNINTSHNTYLTVAAELGILALVLYAIPTLWWLISSVRVWSRLPRSGFWSRSLLVLLWLALLANFTVSNFMDMIRYNIFGTTIFWMGLGLIATLISTVDENTSLDSRAAPNLTQSGETSR